MHGHSATINGGWESAFLHCNLHLDEIRGDYPNCLSALQMFRSRRAIYWASSANPWDDSCTFAVAASNGTYLLAGRQCTWDLEKGMWDRETVAVDWLNPNVVIKAHRFGAVKLWDTRYFAENAEPRIRHPTDITHVRRIDENMIAVAGLQRTVRRVPPI